MRKGHRIHKHAGLLVTAAFVLLLVRLAPAAPSLTLQAAEIAPDPTGAMMLSATRAGNRIVAVGDHGIVLLSDENGANFRQAKSVPVRSALTGVSFIDDKTGWVVGHWGVVLKTEDGGETWEVQRSDTSVDKPLFSVYFKDKDHGLAVGLWSLMITTSDGGRTWSTVGVPVPPGGNKADLNLFKVFADGHGTLFVAAEQGMILRSDDGGSGWTYLPTGYNGSFWTGIGLQDGALLVGGAPWDHLPQYGWRGILERVGVGGQKLDNRLLRNRLEGGGRRA